MAAPLVVRLLIPQPGLRLQTPRLSVLLPVLWFAMPTGRPGLAFFPRKVMRLFIFPIPRSTMGSLLPLHLG